ncbi:MAG: hypothetical protein ABIL45_03740 [candidate division WOR-3 bacterium]
MIYIFKYIEKTRKLIQSKKVLSFVIIFEIGFFRFLISFFSLRILGFCGITLYPYIIIKAECYNKEILQHEFVHIKQQKNSLFKFLIRYILEFFKNFCKYFSFSKAYREIGFEKEAEEKKHQFKFII